ncbi:MAG: hypothetical protein JWR21_4197, partial [Herminiimonas sp.]|nr:hypothetical protein [Herminiimonas sp.]MDB5855144.1 hypothetical protein [Herminiimonas sp.]
TISTDLECHACLDLNCSNRPVRTRTPGGVAGERPVRTAPYADQWFGHDPNHGTKPYLTTAIFSFLPPLYV